MNKKSDDIRFIDQIEDEASLVMHSSDSEQVANIFVLAAGALRPDLDVVSEHEKKRLWACLARMDAWLLQHARELSTDIAELEAFIGPHGDKPIKINELDISQLQTVSRLSFAADLIASFNEDFKDPHLSSLPTTRWRLTRRTLDWPADVQPRATSNEGDTT